MPISNYPTGFAQGVNIRGVPVLNSYPGSIFWVDSLAGADGNKGTFDRPFATIDYAIGQCSAGNGDIIAVKSGHVETIATASAITCDVAGVSIIGVGAGAARPTITFATSTAATIVISAASVTIQNIILTTSIDQIVSPIVVTGSDAYLDVEWRDPATNVEALRAILGAAGADNLKIKLKYMGQTGGSHCVNAIRLVGSDNAIIDVDFYGKASTSVIEFVTTACTNVNVTGYFYNSGTVNGTKNIVDTVTGSTWYADRIVDGAAATLYSGGSGAALASSSTSTIATNQNAPTADSTANTLSRDVVGNKTDASVFVAGTTNSIAAYVKGHAAIQERVVTKGAATLTSGQTLFAVAGGPIQILALWSECVTANDGTASTLQYNCTPTSGSAQTISGASASLASAAAGASVSLIGTALSTAALLNANGPNLGMSSPGGIIAPVGSITAIVGVGSTTGTWRHFIRYKPLTSVSIVS